MRSCFHETLVATYREGPKDSPRHRDKDHEPKLQRRTFNQTLIGVGVHTNTASPST